jgi:hypothetical protein
MGNQARSSGLYPLEPLTAEDVSYPNYPLPMLEETLQLQADTANLVEGRVDPSVFSDDYLHRLKMYYRFYGSRSLIGSMGTNSYGKVTRTTLDKI